MPLRAYTNFEVEEWWAGGQKGERPAPSWCRERLCVGPAWVWRAISVSLPLAYSLTSGSGLLNSPTPTLTHPAPGLQVPSNLGTPSAYPPFPRVLVPFIETFK